VAIFRVEFSTAGKLTKGAYHPRLFSAMLDSIIQFSIKNKLIIGLFTLALVLYGLYETTRLPIDAVPDITNNQVQVITISPSLGAPDIERQITFPIEQANANIPGLKEIRSFSRFGLSLVTIVFHDDVDIYWARQQINERLQQAQSQIPAGIGQPSLAPVTTGLGEIFQYIVRAKPGYESKYSLMELRTIQDWIVRRQLLGTPGVADVSTFGGELKQVEVSVMPDRLQAMSLSISDVFDALEQNNQNTGGAYIEKGPRVLYIRSEGLLKGVADIENIPVKNIAGQAPVRIRDIATVQTGAATRYGAVCYNDEGEVAGAVVMMLKGENSSTVIKRVKEKIADIEKTLPEGVTIEAFLDRTKMVNNAISTVETNLLEGALIVVFVLVFFLGNFRAGLIVASVIPLSMLFAIILMNYFGVGGNLMSLGAIDFGLIVDGAVIVVEAIMHQITHSKHFKEVNSLSKEQMDGEVHHASTRIMNAAIFGQIIILIVYLPILALEGIEGKMFKPMALTVGFAVFGAFILSLTYVPMMSALLFNRKLNHQKTWSDRLMNWLERMYQHSLEKVLNFPKTVAAVSLTLLTASLLLMTTLGGEFIPELEEGDFAVDTRVLPGSSLTTTIRTTQQTAGILLHNFPEVQKVVTKIGSGEIPTDPMPIEASDMMVILKDKKEWTSAKTFDELAEKMSEKIAEIPGVTAGFQYPVQMRFNELMTGARQDVVCKIFGEDLDSLAYYAEKLGEISRSLEGATEFYVEAINGMPQIVINYNRELLAKYGLTIETLNKTVNAGFAGAVAGQVFEGEKRFDLVVRVSGAGRKSIADVQNLPITTPQGIQIPLRQVAQVEEIEGPNQIQREDAKRRIVVGFNVRGRDVQSIVQELQQKVSTGIKFSPGYYVKYGGAFENLQAAKERLSTAVPIALLLIFLMLYFAFGSVRQGLLIFSAIPLSAIGGIVALWMRDMPFSISAGVGFIALFGVAVLNGIVLLSEFNRLIQEGWHDQRRIVLMGTKIRLRSILMTALAPSLGFIPMAASMGAGAEVQRPLATVVIGGIVSATLLTLFVLPLLFVYFDKSIKHGGHGSKTAALIVFLLGSVGISAQGIGLDEAVQLAWQNNPEIRSAQLNEQFYAQLKKTWNAQENTDFGMELGQFNSLKTDNKLSVSQSFMLPTVYKRQKTLLHENQQVAEAELRLSRARLRQELGAVYLEFMYLENRRTLLQKADSIFGRFEEKSRLRYRQGESNLLELNSATIQRQEVLRQLSQLNMEIRQVLYQFNTILNTGQQLTPQKGLPDALAKIMADSIPAYTWPAVQVQQHQLAAAQAQWALEKAKRLPVLSLGLNSQSIIGYQTVEGQDRFYNGLKRFNYLSLGASLPLFSKGWRANSKAWEFQVQKQQNDLDWLVKRSEMDRTMARNNALKYLESLRYYEQEILPAAKNMQELATKQLAAGDIDYLQWTLLIGQSMQVEQQFETEKYNYHQALLRLQQYSNL
jgi:cobalt-zinc-cadmium resistance protein CzcA